MEKIIEVQNLKKSYGDVKAVNGIDFYVETGKLFAFLGPNGAGKSTTIDIICTFLKPDEGEVFINGLSLGKDDDKIRSIIGAVFQDGLLDNLLTVKENLKIRGSFYGLKGDELSKAVDSAMEVTGVEDFARRLYGKLSGGQRRRADIARALINTPKILFLDEPTTGLDPQTRKNVWETILKLQNERNMTIFLTTHYMEEATAADYVVVIDDGKISAKGTPSELREKYSSDILILYSKDETNLLNILKTTSLNYKKIGDQFVIKIPSTMASLPIIEQCKQHINGFEVHNGTMDDAFIGITGKEIRE
ncbi:ATP-binding cassette domain-containing protein [Clostridium sp.]|uniref:ABC transporter ATP-binding protein n=1 Tax=Clostridium sp. TaxID=1506 RepID=UPI0032170AE5